MRPCRGSLGFPSAKLSEQRADARRGGYLEHVEGMGCVLSALHKLLAELFSRKGTHSRRTGRGGHAIWSGNVTGESRRDRSWRRVLCSVHNQKTFERAVVRAGGLQLSFPFASARRT